MTRAASASSARQGAALLPMALLVLLGVSWGLHFPIMKFAARSGLPYSGIAMAMTGGVAAALLAIGMARGKLPAFRRGSLPFYVVCAILGYLVPYLLSLFAASRVDAGMLTLIGSTSPIVTLCLAAALGAERVTAIRLFSIALGIASVAVLVLPQARLADSAVLSGILVAFGIPLAYSSYHVYVSRKWPVGLDSFRVACGEAVTALVLMLPLFFLTNGMAVFRGGWTAGHWAILAMIVYTTLTCYLYFEIVRLAGPVFVSQANFITVVAGVLWGIALHGEEPGRWLWLSVALLVASLGMLALNRRSGLARGPGQQNFTQAIGGR